MGKIGSAICASLTRYLFLTVLPSEFTKNVAVPTTRNSKLNDLRKILCLKKSKVSVERILVCNAIENLAERGIHCLPCSYTNDAIDLLPW